VTPPATGTRSTVLCETAWSCYLLVSSGPRRWHEISAALRQSDPTIRRAMKLLQGCGIPLRLVLRHGVYTWHLTGCSPEDAAVRLASAFVPQDMATFILGRKSGR